MRDSRTCSSSGRNSPHADNEAWSTDPVSPRASRTPCKAVRIIPRLVFDDLISGWPRRRRPLPKPAARNPSDDLYVYCYRVASVAGLMRIEISRL